MKIFLLLLLFISVGTVSSAQSYKGVARYFQHGKNIALNNDDFLLYLVFNDTITGLKRVEKPMIKDSFYLARPANATCELVFKYKRDCFIIPLHLFFSMQNQSLIIGCSKIYESDKNIRKHRFFSPHEEHEWHVPGYYYMEHSCWPNFPLSKRGVVKAPLLGEQDSTQNLSDNLSKFKHKRIIWMAYQMHLPNSSQQVRMRTGDKSICYIDIIDEYLVGDIRQYKRKSRKYLKYIEQVYNKAMSADEM